MTLALVFLVAYFALVLLTARVFSRRIRDLKDFFLAGRSLGALPVAMTFAASWFGAASTLGSINAFHDLGISGAWQIVIPSVLSFVVITLFMARPVARQDFLSQPEAVAVHYGRVGRLLLAIIILCSVTTLIGSQMVAAGKVFQSVFGLDVFWATLLSTLAVVLYAMVGGYFAVVVTDMLQLVLIGVGFLILLGFVLGQAAPVPGDLPRWMAAQPSGFWDLSRDWQSNVFLVFTFVLAWCIAPEMWQRMSSTRNPDLAFRAGLQGTFIMLCLFAVVMAIGLLSPRIVGHSDAVLIDLALAIPVPALSAMVLLGFVAAVTSTMDSSMNVGSLTLTRDLYQGFLRPGASTAELLWVSRIATVLIVIPAMIIALAYQDIIQILWISADIYASTMFFPVVGILHLKNPGRWSGILAMAFGGTSVIFSALVQSGWVHPPFPWPDWPYSTLISVACSGLGFGLGYLWGRMPAPSREEPPGLPGLELSP